MNWKAIKHIYREVLKYKRDIEYLDNNKYNLLSYYANGKKEREQEYKDGQANGYGGWWYDDEREYCKEVYRNGRLIEINGKLID